MYGVIYKVVDKDGITIVGDENSVAACFSKYVYSNQKFNKTNICYIYLPIVPTAKKSIYTNVSNNVTTLNDEQIVEYFSQLDKAGFKNSLIKEPNRYVLKVEEKDYLNLSHLRIGLDYFRMLWEDVQNKTLPLFYNSFSEDFRQKLYQKFGWFETIQAYYMYLFHLGKNVGCHYCPCYNMLHGLSVGSALSPKEIFEYFESFGNHKEGSYEVYQEINNLKSGKVLPNYALDAEMKEKVKNLKLDRLEEWAELLKFCTIRDKKREKKVEKKLDI